MRKIIMNTETKIILVRDTMRTKWEPNMKTEMKVVMKISINKSKMMTI